MVFRMQTQSLCLRWDVLGDSETMSQSITRRQAHRSQARPWQECCWRALSCRVSFSFLFLKNLFICFYFWLRWVSAAAHGLSLVAASGGYSSLRCAGFRCVGFSSCGTWAQQLWLTGLVAPRHMGSSRTRARTHVPCTGRQILNHCATRKTLSCRVSISRIRISEQQPKWHTWEMGDTGILNLLVGSGGLPRVHTGI